MDRNLQKITERHKADDEAHARAIQRLIADNNAKREKEQRFQEA